MHKLFNFLILIAYYVNVTASDNCVIVNIIQEIISTFRAVSNDDAYIILSKKYCCDEGHKDEWYTNCDFLGKKRMYIGLQAMDDFMLTSPKLVAGQPATYIFVPTTFQEFIGVVQKVSNQSSINWWISIFYIVIPEAIINDTEKQNYLDVVKPFRFPIDSQVFLVSINATAKEGDVWESYYVKDTWVLNHVLTIKMRKSGGIISGGKVVEQKVRRRENFRGTTVVAVSKNDSAYESWKKTQKGDITEADTDEFALYIYFDLKYTLNFTDHLILGDWDYQFNPSLNKAVAHVPAVVTNKADIALMQSTLVLIRAQDQSFLQPTHSSVVSAFFTQPVHNTIRNLVTMPFEKPLWYVLIALWALMIFIVKGIRCLQKLMAVETVKKSLGHGRDEDALFCENVGFWLVTLSCQKSWYSVPKFYVLRIVFFVGSMAGVFIYVAYSAAIVSSLSVNIDPVQEFSDLLRWKYKFTVHEQSTTLKYFLERLIDKHKLTQHVETTDTEHEVKHLLHSGKALLSYPVFFYMAAKGLNYEEHFLSETLYTLIVTPIPYQSGMFVRKNSPYNQFFNYKIMAIKEHGLNKRYGDRYDSKYGGLQLRQKGVKKLIKSIDPVSLHDLFTTFSIILVGIGAGLLILAIETLFYRTKLAMIHKEKMSYGYQD